MIEYGNGDDIMDKKHTRYMSGFVSYKTVSCRMSEFEASSVEEFCRRNNISKSLFLNCAAMYCIDNNVSAEELLKHTLNNTNFDYRELIENEKDI